MHLNVIYSDRIRKNRYNDSELYQICVIVSSKSRGYLLLVKDIDFNKLGYLSIEKNWRDWQRFWIKNFKK
jgi:hypothetical protein